MPGDLPKLREMSRDWHHPALTSRSETEGFLASPLGLIRLEQELRMRGAIENKQLLRFGSFFVFARIRGNRGPSAFASSRATMNNEAHLRFSAGPFSDAPRKMMRSGERAPSRKKARGSEFRVRQCCHCCCTRSPQSMRAPTSRMRFRNEFLWDASFHTRSAQNVV